MSYIRNRYDVPAKRGGRVRYNPNSRVWGDRFARFGTIKSARGGHLKILMDGEKRTGIYHPTYALEYLTIKG